MKNLFKTLLVCIGLCVCLYTAYFLTFTPVAKVAKNYTLQLEKDFQTAQSYSAAAYSYGLKDSEWDGYWTDDYKSYNCYGAPLPTKRQNANAYLGRT